MDEIDRIIFSLKQEEVPSLSDVELVCRLSYDILNGEKNVIRVKSPVTLCGDVHGDFEDVLEIFEIFGEPPEGRYAFLGDYVDRGPNSVQTFILLLCYKIKYPSDFYLIRGNHETSSLNQYFGFCDEVLSRYSNFNAWKCFLEVFNVLPVAVLVDDNIIGVHGGLSSRIKTIDELECINRKLDDPTQPPYNDILWNDPYEGLGFSTSARDGCYLWGSDVTEEFLNRNSLKMVVRGHQSVDGFTFNHNNQVLTVFSAPCYHSTIKEGSVLEVISPEKMQITSFRPRAWGRKLHNSIFVDFIDAIDDNINH